MRLSAKSGLYILCVFSVLALFSCRTPAPAPQQPIARTPEKPGAEPVVEVPAVGEKPPAYTRIAFAEQLSRLLSAGKNDEALALFDTVPEPDASETSILLLKLSIMLSSGRLEESAVLANRMEQSSPDNPDVLYIQAVLAGARNDGTARSKYLNRVLAVQPGSSQAMTAIGLDLYARKNYPLAKSWLIKAVAADPDNTEALLGLARVYYMQADLVKAGDTLNLAIGKEPGYSVLWAERARVKSETNDLSGALDDIKKAVELDPGVYSQWVDYGGYLITTAKQQEARKAFTEAVLLEPDSYLAYIYRAGLNDDLGYTDEAIADYSAIVRLYPQYFYASESLGTLLWGRGDYEGSRAAFQQALAYSPGNSSYALMATLCLYRLGKNVEAKAFMGKYITTLDRSSTEYFLCRLFVDRSGDVEVLARITKEKDINVRNRMLFYSAMYYELFGSKSIAQKYYLEVISLQAPNFFEYRLSQWAIRNLETDGDKTVQG